MPSKNALQYVGPITPGVVVVVGITLLMLLRLRQPEKTTAPSFLSQQHHQVIDVAHDGTLHLQSGERVRLLGVQPLDPPCEAFSTFLADRLLDREIRLEFERERRDREHRWLSYVWLDDAFLNEEVLLHGIARRDASHLLNTPTRKQLEGAETAARNLKRGCWSNDDAEN